MQVASTHWPDIKSQKISERRFMLKWTKCSLRTQFRPLKTGQDQRDQDKAAQDSLLDEAGGGWSLGQADRPTMSADLACGPHCLIEATWRLLIGPLGRLQGSHPVASCYKYKGWVEIRIHTHTHHTSLISCLVFRLSGVQESSSRRICSRVWYGFISSSLL